MSQRIVTVFGATGQQGGSVIESFLSAPQLSHQYKLRAVTRDVTKDSAKALAQKGVEVVQGDMSDSNSIAGAVKGSYAVFGVTNFWEHGSKDKEVAQGKAVADASKAAGVRHLVFSTLPSATEVSGGKLTHIPHFDGKNEIAKYIESIKGDQMLATYFMPGFYMANLKQFVKKGQDGVPSWNTPFEPETKIPLFDAAKDTGKYVVGIIEAGEKANGKSVQAVSEWLKPKEVTDILGREVGTTVNFNTIPAEVFQSFLPPAIAEELTENMVLVRDYSYYGKGTEKQQAEHDSFLAKGTKTNSWAEFVKDNGPWTF